MTIISDPSCEDFFFLQCSIPRANTVLAQERNSIHSCRINVEMCLPISSRPPFSISAASFRKHTLIVFLHLNQCSWCPNQTLPALPLRGLLFRSDSPCILTPQTPPPSSQAIHGSPSPLAYPSSPIAPVTPPSSSQSTLPILPDLPLLGYSPSLTPTTQSLLVPC